MTTTPPASPSAEASAAPTPPVKERSTVAWVGSTYFAEGLPYMLVRILSSVYFTDIGAKERYLGYLNFLGVPWNLKFLWAPFVDRFATKRSWMIAIQAAIALLTAAVAATALVASGTHSASQAAGPMGESVTTYLVVIAVIFVAMAFLSATNDIAIDGYYLEALSNKGDQAAYSGYRVLAYRVAMVFARSGLVEVAAVVGRRAGGNNPHLAWAAAFGFGAVTMLLLTLFHAWRLPKVEVASVAKRSNDALRDYGRAFLSYLQQDKIGWILAFIVTYKLGDEILFSMVTTFLKRELFVSNDQLAWIAGLIGAAGSIGGAMLGGWAIKRYGLKRAIWPLTLGMNVNIWAYCWLAWQSPDARTTEGVWWVAAIHGYEQFAAGLGSAALTVYLLRTCRTDFKAAHYAIGSAIMSLGSTLVGGFGGQIVEQIGYLNLFILAFLASIPAMALLFLIPFHDDAPSKA